jgi:hypothetical protein
MPMRRNVGTWGRRDTGGQTKKACPPREQAFEKQPKYELAGHAPFQKSNVKLNRANLGGRIVVGSNQEPPFGWT